jgi:hypothetical protein
MVGTAVNGLFQQCFGRDLPRGFSLHARLLCPGAVEMNDEGMIAHQIEHGSGVEGEVRSDYVGRMPVERFPYPAANGSAARPETRRLRGDACKPREGGPVDRGRSDDESPNRRFSIGEMSEKSSENAIGTATGVL